MRKVFFVSTVLTAIISLYYFGLIEISIGQERTELDSEVRVVNNSAIETLKYFSQNENEQLFESKIIFLNFWYPQCGACIKEKPNLYKVQDKFKSQDIRFLAYCPPPLYLFSTKKENLKNISHNYETIEFKSGIKRSILKVAAINGMNVDTTFNSFPNSIIISTANDSILYFTQENIKKSDLSDIYQIIQNELDEIN